MSKSHRVSDVISSINCDCCQCRLESARLLVQSVMLDIDKHCSQYDELHNVMINLSMIGPTVPGYSSGVIDGAAWTVN